MYPQLMNQAARLAPLLSRMLPRGGMMASPFWKASNIDTPEVDASKVQPMPPRPAPSSGPAPPISTDNSVAPATYSRPTPPSVPALGGLGLFPAAPATPMNWLEMAQYKAPTAPAPAAVAPVQQASPVPMPRPRPDGAPAAEPDTSFFMRNALMMQDPLGAGLIDPTGAASVRGPDLISKMMGYLHNKASA